MQNEEVRAVQLPSEESQVGDGISPPPVAGKSDYEIEERVIAANAGIGYSREELRRFVRRDQRYQKLCSILKTLEKEPPIDPNQVEAAKELVRKAFLRWQRLRARTSIRKEEIVVVKAQMHLRMRKIAMKRATEDIRRIQQVMGIETMKEEQGGQEFRDKLSGRRVSRALAIAQTLHAPLVFPQSKLTDESKPTQS